MMNLLPQPWQAKLKDEEIFKTVSILGIVAVCATLSFVMMLLLVKTFYSVRISSLEVAAREKEQEMNIFDVKSQIKEAADFAGLMSRVGNFYDGQVKVTRIFALVSGALPGGVRLTGFSYAGASVDIKGEAKKRDDLVVFKKNLETLPVFGKVDFPPDNWLKSEDISFGAELELAADK